MKALIATPYYHPKIGGLENYARQLNRALHTQEKWDIVVVTSNHEGKQDTSEVVDDMRVYRLGTKLKFSNTPIGLWWPFKIRHIIGRERPDVIIAHSPVPSMADAAALAAGKTPLILIYHLATLQKEGSAVFTIAATIYGLYQQLTFGKARKILAVSEYVKSSFTPRQQRKTSVLPNAVWAHEVEPREKQGGDELLFIGSLDRTHMWKGLEAIIEALALYRDSYGTVPKLTVMGDGNHRMAYEAQAARLGLEQSIVFVGAQSGDAKEATLRRASLLVSYPTTGNDAFPTVLLEAWSRGVPALLAAIGPMPSLIADGKDGFLVKPNDPVVLAEKLHEVLSLPQAKIAAIVRTAAARTAAQYTWERQAADVAAIAKGLVR